MDDRSTGGPFRFDTLDKKPHLYNILIITVFAAAAIAAIAFTGADRSFRITGTLIFMYLAVVLTLLMRAFFGQLRYNPYSYNTIYYVGFFLFGLSVFVSATLGLKEVFASGSRDGAAMMFGILAESPVNFVILSMPFILVFCGLLVVSNIALIRKEGGGFGNVLGIILSVMLAGGGVLILAAGRYLNRTGMKPGVLLFVTGLAAVIYLYFECMVIGTIIADLIAATHEPDKDKDFLIVLGCALKKDGTPGNILKGRLDRALRFYHDQREKTGEGPVFIVSGGKGADEAVSEACSMEEYLLSAGIPAEKIIREERSTNTYENMLYSGEIMNSIKKGGKTAFSTTGYHVFRSGLKARRVKLRAVGMGAPSKWYFWPNAAVREFAGLLTGHIGKQILIIIGLVAYYVLAYMGAYRF